MWSMVAAVGLEGITVAETLDAFFVTQKDRVQDGKSLVVALIIAERAKPVCHSNVLPSLWAGTGLRKSSESP